MTDPSPGVPGCKSPYPPDVREGPKRPAPGYPRGSRDAPAMVQPAPKPPVEPWKPGETLQDEMRQSAQAAMPTEHEEQAEYFRWVRSQPGDDFRHIFAIPNGGDRKARVAQEMSDEGVERGVPDLMITLGRGRFLGAFLETKRRDGGTVSEDQKRWHQRLRRAGYYVEVCKGAAELQTATLWYLRQEQP